ncbi:MAG: DUF4173 domain-containing protein, partial [Anaerolineales bacterium]
MTENESNPTLVLTSKSTFIWTVLLIGWLFDLLFWDKVPGISIPIYLAILLAGGFFLARQQKLSPAPGLYWLLVPIIFFAIMTIIRLEPFTSFLNTVAALVLMALLSHSFLGGKWWQYTFKDYLTSAFSLGLDAIVRPVAVFTSQPKPETLELPEETDKKQGLRKSLAILRGLLIAFPIVLVFAGMLAEADPVFDQALSKFLDFFNIENLGEYILRAFLISFIAYIVLGVYLHAFYKNHDESFTDDRPQWLKPFLGITESVIVLGSINLLFLAFVAIQFQYFFGGESNINLAGFTYAEYARRGFGELVAVAIFSLLLFMGLSFITKKEGKSAHRVLSILGIVLFALVTVILVSSFQRLLLYEQAYGFTRLRAYTHVFMIWLGGLLLAVSLLELFRKQRYFAFAALVAGIGFITTLDLINIDSLIVKQNVSRYQEGETLDIAYLASLTVDAVPTLVDLYQSSPAAEKQVLSGAIACHAELNYRYDYADGPDQRYSWVSFHFSRLRAQQVGKEL